MVFDRDRPLEPIVHALEDDTHAAAADLADDSVAADVFGNGGGL